MSDTENVEPEDRLDQIQQEEEERNQIWQCFMQFDQEKQGVIHTQDLKKALEVLGEKVSDSQVFRIISQVDPENTCTISFDQFKSLVMEKRENERGTSDEDLLDAFVAMGGEEDGGGCVDAEKLIETIKKEFEMTIDIEALINDVDEDGSGEIEFDEFKELLQAGGDVGDDDEDDE